MKRTPLKRTGFKSKSKPSKTEFTEPAKAEMRIRSSGRCEVGSTICRGEAVVFHHIKRRSQGGKGIASNGLHVCVPCHTWIHDHPAESFKNGWLVRGHGDPDT